MNKLNILVAYPYFKKGVVDILQRLPKDSYDLIVDSGAFTAWNSNKIISLDDYCKFLDSIQHLGPFYAVQLDVFGDAEKSWNNYLIMKSRGYNVMPVFTRGESLDKLEEMYTHTDYIMFGGVTIGAKNRNYVKWFLERNKNRDIHWLGFVNMDFIKHYKPRSVDSSSWTSAGRFGTVALYAGSGNLKTFNKRVFTKKPNQEVFLYAQKTGISKEELKILSYSEAWHTTWKFDGDLAANLANKQSAAQFITTVSHVHRSIDVEKKLKTKIYLACGSDLQIQLLINAKQFLEKRGVI